MAGWLAPDSKFYNGLVSVTDTIIVNVLLLIFSLPVVTAGAALAGAHAALLKQVREEGSSPAKAFWTGFRTSFARATIVWLLILLAFLVSAWEIWAIRRMDLGAAGTAATVVALTGVVLVVCFAIWFFPLISQSEKPLADVAKRSAILAIGYLPRTLVCLATLGVQPLLLYMNVDIIAILIFANMVILPAATLYVHDLLIERQVSANF
ncbi:DUF624 domain-containing protein [Flaviflexus equikiangi]|uniref:DUF624 domain-containing protein n=1 Tax=Flaviflexus equikiangi TaxID=2758573 RepID=UPI0015F4967D|nr:DUF624 domain-containing protein [Flaviflexus equikiangi]